MTKLKRQKYAKEEMSTIPMQNLPMLTIPKMPLTLFKSHLTLWGIDLSSDEFYQIHALSSRHPPPSKPGHPPNHLSGPNLNNQDPKSPSKGMMDQSICHYRSIGC